MRGARSWSRAVQLLLVLLRTTRTRPSSGISARPPHLATRSPHPTHAAPPARPLRRRHGEAAALAEGLLELMDSDRDGSAAFPDFLRVGGPRRGGLPGGSRHAAPSLVHATPPAQPAPATACHLLPPRPPQCYDEFLARTLADVQPPSKRRRTDSRMG